jgi:transposase
MNDKNTDDLAKKEKLIELRATGSSMDKIASELSMSKSTVAKWIHDFESDIKNRKYQEYEVLLDKYDLSKQKRLETYLNLLENVLDELKSRDLASMNVRDLLKLAEMMDSKIKQEMIDFTYDTGEYESIEVMDFIGRSNETKKLKIDY